jgi:D-alanyl-D-alanine carboxypeptidase
VVIGADHRLTRFSAAERLLQDAFDRYRLVVPVHTGELLTERAPVAGGRWRAVPVRTAAEVRMVVPKSAGALQLTRLVALESQPAPVQEGEPVGRIVLRSGDRVVAEIPAVAAVDVPRARPWQLWRSQFFATLLMLRLAVGL